MRFCLLQFLVFISFIGMAQDNYLFIGTYTTGGSKGIYVYKFNATTGKAEWVSNTQQVVNPSYLTISPDHKFVYAVNETNGANPGGVSAFSFDSTKGQLSFLNEVPSGGDDPCYITINKEGNWVFVANYSGGSLAALPVTNKGLLQPYAQLIQNTGKSIHTNRQEKPHVHSVVLSPDEQYLFSADLGTDKEMVYRFNAQAAEPLTPAEPPFIKTEPGGGPRHFTFHPTNKWAYLIEELSGTVVAYRYNNHKLTFIQRIATHPKDYKGAISSADIHISPDGKFLYASNRGDENNLAIFSINQNNGTLETVGYQPTLGIMPRNFLIHPSGKFVLVAHQQSNNVVVFERNITTGLLRPTGFQIKVPNPVCIKLMH